MDQDQPLARLQVRTTIKPWQDPEEFVQRIFWTIKGIYEHRARHEGKDTVKDRGMTRAYNAQLMTAFHILGIYTGWGELRAKDQYEAWLEEGI